MSKKRGEVVRQDEPDVVQPVEYEIVVRGRLDSPLWQELFEGLAVTVNKSGDTVIRAALPDQAALYGLLSRLRDFAVPLVSVNVVGEKRRRAAGARTQPRIDRIHLWMALTYPLIIGALIALAVFSTDSGILDTALALAMLFGALGAVVFAFYRWVGGRFWYWLALVEWAGAALTFLIYLMDEGWLPTALGIAFILLAAAGIISYEYLKHRAQRIGEPREAAHGEPESGVVTGWERLGFPGETGEGAGTENGGYDR